MNPLQRRSVIEQSADYIRESLLKGTWTGRLPGVVRLAEEAGVSKLTMRAALRLLEDEGLVALSENGYSRYATREGGTSKQTKRIGILLPEPLSEQIAQFQQLIIEIQHNLEHAGFVPILFHENLRSLRHSIRRIASVLEKTPVDACLVVGGSREVLEWFATQPLPAMAIFGRAGGLPIARIGPDKTTAMLEAVRHLLELGHKRIVFLNRKERRMPSLGTFERLFLNELESNGIGTSSYNMPDWEETPEGFRKMLGELFRLTPPTALMADEVPVWVATQQFLLQKRIVVPDEVSLIATDSDPAFSWCSPSISHVRWKNAPIVRRVARWVKGVKQGRKDVNQTVTSSEFVMGGTIAPVHESADS